MFQQYKTLGCNLNIKYEVSASQTVRTVSTTASLVKEMTQNAATLGLTRGLETHTVQTTDLYVMKFMSKHPCNSLKTNIFTTAHIICTLNHT